MNIGIDRDRFIVYVCCVNVCMRAYVRACVRACVSVSVSVCLCVSVRLQTMYMITCAGNQPDRFKVQNKHVTYGT